MEEEARRGATLHGVVPPQSRAQPARSSAQREHQHLLGLGYELLAHLGSGGMGEVWRARSLRLDREVAIKRVRSEIPDAEARLVHEARAIARLRHSAIVQVFDVIHGADGAPYLVMELLQGADLGSVLDKQGPLDPVRAVGLMDEIAAGLQAAHVHDIVHRDVKPENIMLTRDDQGRERPVLLDFGISHVFDLDAPTTAPVGTPDFMAPEQVRGDPIGPATDQWSLCVTLYCLICGGSPFHRDKLGEVFEAIQRDRLPFPRDVEMDPAVFAVLARGTRKSPNERYAHLGELRAALHTWLHRQRPARRP